MVRLSRKHLFYLTPLLIFHIAALPLSAADETSAPEAALLSINGTAFFDENSDTVLSSGEKGVAGIIIRLTQGDVEISFAETGESGDYIFSNLTPGDYEILAESADAANLTAPASGGYEVALADLPAYYLDFGFSAPLQENASAAIRQYPLMRPTPEMATAWSMNYNASEMAYLSPEVSATLASYPPASYSLLDQLEYTPSERDQGNCGNCWAWAGTGVMEIDRARQTGASDRLSVQYLNSNFNGGCGYGGACCGGWLSDVADFYQSRGIIVPWNNSNAQYGDTRTQCGSCSALSAQAISLAPSYPLDSISAVTIPTHGQGQEKAIENIKNVLLQGKGVWFAFFLPDDSSWNSFFSFWGRQPNSAVWKPDFSCGKTYNYLQGGGHAVLCLGYNDTDPSNRYWIMLNSWGVTSGRPDGIFRVNMDMNYNCAYAGIGSAFYWMTLDMSYPDEEDDDEDEENSAPDTPSRPQGPAQGTVGAALSYSASDNDSDDDPVTITFDWKDGKTTVSDPVASGQTTYASHAWSRAGSYAVVARATDSQGISSAWSEPLSVKITVNSAPRRPDKPQGPAAGRAGQSYSFASSSIDPNGDDVRLVFDWGDGSQSTTDMLPSGQKVTATHAWTRAGSFYVKVRAEDGKGGKSAWSASARIRITSAGNSAPLPPAAPSGVSSGVAGKSYTYLARSSDPDLDSINYIIDWGDGNSTRTGSLASGAFVRSEHTWCQPGTYQIRIMATDSNGENSTWSSAKSVKINAASRGKASQAAGQSSSRQQKTEKSSCGCGQD